MQLEHGDNWDVTAYSQAWDAIHAAAPITAPRLRRCFLPCIRTEVATKFLALLENLRQ